ncbi:hypothetical protein F0U61_15115 [Archangium violaceum]|nr:hypothetical protein F0U61_15115 [Archangium violaceum]
MDRRRGRGAHVPPVCPSSGERGGTRGHGVGRDGMTSPRRIKALAGNSASCLGFSIALFTGSIPAASTGSKEPRAPSGDPGFLFPPKSRGAAGRAGRARGAGS